MASIKLHDKLLIDSVIGFMYDYYKINAKVIVKQKSNVGLMGDIVLSDASVNRNKFTLHFNPTQSKPMVIKTLIHELTHVHQVSSKKLQPGKDWKSLNWKGKHFITVRDLKKLMKSSGISEYMKLPWEREAYDNMKKLYPKYLKSKYFKNLRGKNTTLDYILDNEPLLKSK